MFARQSKSAAVVLPAVKTARLQDSYLRFRLQCSQLRELETPLNVLQSILVGLELPVPLTGLGALRMWGQTGERPGVWIAAADPVYLEPRLDHLCLHALGSEAVTITDMRSIFDELQMRLGSDARFSFARIGKCGYLRTAEAIETARLPANAIDQRQPDEFLPVGDKAGAYRKLIGEIEMLLHESPANARRGSAGLVPINSLWLWGGGFAPEPIERACPPLFADDPLIRGCWLSFAGHIVDWPGSIDKCLEAADGSFVAVPPFADKDDDALSATLHKLFDALRAHRIDELHLWFRDGIEARVNRFDRWRFWRWRQRLIG